MVRACSLLDEEYGKIFEDELKPGASQMSITEQNKEEHISLLIDWVINRGVKEQVKTGEFFIKTANTSIIFYLVLFLKMSTILL